LPQGPWAISFGTHLEGNYANSMVEETINAIIMIVYIEEFLTNLSSAFSILYLINETMLKAICILYTSNNYMRTIRPYYLTPLLN
jgi:hypothetical protein